VWKAGTHVVINLPQGDQPLGIRIVHRMRDLDVVAAVRLVEANVELLLTEWRKHHG